MDKKQELNGFEDALLKDLHVQGNNYIINWGDWRAVGSLQRKGLICRAPGGGFRLTPMGIHHLDAWDRPVPEMRKRRINHE